MKSTKRPYRFQEIPRKYDDLVKLFMPRPIHDDVELTNATEIADVMAGHALNHEQEDYFNLITDLIEAYESERHPVVEAQISGLELLRFLLEENGINASDLARLFGVHRSLGAKILNGERRLTTDHIKILCDRFKVSADLFFR